MFGWVKKTQDFPTRHRRLYLFTESLCLTLTQVSQVNHDGKRWCCGWHHARRWNILGLKSMYCREEDKVVWCQWEQEMLESKMFCTNLNSYFRLFHLSSELNWKSDTVLYLVYILHRYIFLLTFKGIISTISEKGKSPTNFSDTRFSIFRFLIGENSECLSVRMCVRLVTVVCCCWLCLPL